MGFGEMIKSARKAKKYSQAKLGLAVGVSAAAICDWENEKYAPTDASNISALEMALGFESGSLYRHLYGNPMKHPPRRGRAKSSQAA